LEERWREEKEGEIRAQYFQFFQCFVHLYLSMGKVMTGQSRWISRIDRSTIPVTALFSSSALKEIQEELSSAKLIIKLLQTEGSTNEHAGYGTIEPRNLIQSNEQNTRKTKENKWIEVIPSRYRRTKQEKIDYGKRQVETANRYKMLENLQEQTKTADGPDMEKMCDKYT
jgi:hypothetical protein